MGGSMRNVKRKGAEGAGQQFDKFANFIFPSFALVVVSRRKFLWTICWWLLVGCWCVCQKLWLLSSWLLAGGWIAFLPINAFIYHRPAATAFNTILQTIFDKIEYKFVGEWKEVMPTVSTWIKFAFFLPVSSHHIPASVMRPERGKKI